MVDHIPWYMLSHLRCLRWLRSLRFRRRKVWQSGQVRLAGGRLHFELGVKDRFRSAARLATVAGALGDRRVESMGHGRIVPPRPRRLRARAAHRRRGTSLPLVCSDRRRASAAGRSRPRRSNKSGWRARRPASRRSLTSRSSSSASLKTLPLLIIGHRVWQCAGRQQEGQQVGRLQETLLQEEDRRGSPAIPQLASLGAAVSGRARLVHQYCPSGRANPGTAAPAPLRHAREARGRPRPKDRESLTATRSRYSPSDP